MPISPWDVRPRGFSLDSARSSAWLVREAWPWACEDKSFDVEEVVRTFGWRIRVAELSTGGRGLEALLIPLPDGAFEVVIDAKPDALPGDEGFSAGSALVRRLRIAHELGHSLFYSHGKPARRLTRPTKDEEEFCDEFARTLVGSSG